MNITMKDIGSKCKKFRLSRGYYQNDVAKDTGYTIENISAFETGRNDNGKILLWYFIHGMKIEELIGGTDNGENI